MYLEARHVSVLARIQEVGEAATFSHETSDYDEDTGLHTNLQLTEITGHVVPLEGDMTSYPGLQLAPEQRLTLLFVPNTLGDVPPLGSTVLYKGVLRRVRARKELLLGCKVVTV